MVCLVDLQSTFNALDKTKEDGQNENQHGDPECGPLNFVSAVMPKALDRGRILLIEPFFQRQELIAPVLEILFSTLVR